MARLPKMRCTREFKIHAESMAKDERFGVAVIVHRLSIYSKALPTGELGLRGVGFRKKMQPGDVDAENSRLRLPVHRPLPGLDAAFGSRQSVL